jgi:putative tryptophan/tyrosine transport system substrate-binding protein
LCFAARLNVESVEVRGAEDFVAALPRILRRSPVAIVMIEDTLTYSYRLILAEFTLKNRVPAIVAGQAFAEAGGLMSYGARMSDLFRRAANQVDKVLRGAKPADLPVEQPTKFELVINLKTAKALGLTIPQSLLVRADEIISDGPAGVYHHGQGQGRSLGRNLLAAPLAADLDRRDVAVKRRSFRCWRFPS